MGGFAVVGSVFVGSLRWQSRTAVVVMSALQSMMCQLWCMVGVVRRRFYRQVCFLVVESFVF